MAERALCAVVESALYTCSVAGEQPVNRDEFGRHERPSNRKPRVRVAQPGYA